MVSMLYGADRGVCCRSSRRRTDGASSKGVTKVEKPSDLSSAIATALAAAIRDPSQWLKIVMK